MYTPIKKKKKKNGLYNNYVFTDAIAQVHYNGKIYYRIKQTDADGKLYYSKVQLLKTEISEIEIYPNPVTDRIYFSNRQQIKTIQLFSADSKSIPVSLGNQNYIYVKALAKGTYFIKTISNQNKMGVFHFIKL